MNEEVKTLLGFIGKTLNMPVDEVATLVIKVDGDKQTIIPEGMTALEDKYKARILDQKKEVTDAHDTGHQKATRELGEKRDKEIREKFGVSSDKKGVDLVDEIITAKTDAAGKGKDITEDDVKKHPVYKKAVDDLTKKATDVETEWKNKLTERENAEARKSILEKVQAEASKQFQAMNPVLSTDAEKAKMQMKIGLLDKLEGNEYRITESGEIIMMKDGKDLQDGFGNRVKFNDFVKDTAKQYFDFAEGDKRAGTGNTNDSNTQAAAKKFNFKRPATEAEYIKAINDSKTVEEKAALMEVWTKGPEAQTT